MSEETPPKIRPIDADADDTASSEHTRTTPKVPPVDPPRSTRRGDSRKLKEALERFYATIGGGVATAGMFTGNIGMVASGTNIATRSDEVSEAWMELADTNPKVKKFLESFMEGSSVANLVAAHLSMVVPLIAAQGIVPAQMGEFFLSEEAKKTAMAFQAQAQATAAAGANGNGN